MSSDFLDSVGRQINRIRTAKGMSLSQVARSCGKSKASIHNYETGKTAVDVETLLRLAQILDVAPQQFFFMPEGGMDEDIYPFGKVETLYLYHRQGAEQFLSVVKPWRHAEAGEHGVTMFYKVAAPDIPDSCSCVYHGVIFSHYNILSFFMNNHFNNAEHVLANFSFRGMTTSALRGIISGIDSYTLIPVAFRVILSSELMKAQLVDDMLEPTREDIQVLRTKGVIKAQNL